MECKDCGNEIEENQIAIRVQWGHNDEGEFNDSSTGEDKHYCSNCFAYSASTRRVELLKIMGYLELDEHKPFEKDDVLQSLVSTMPEEQEVKAFTITREQVFDLMLNGYAVGRATPDRTIAVRLCNKTTDWEAYYERHKDVYGEDIDVEGYSEYAEMIDNLEEATKTQ